MCDGEQCLGDDIRGRGTDVAVPICALSLPHHPAVPLSVMSVWLPAVTIATSCPLCAPLLPVDIAAECSCSPLCGVSLFRSEALCCVTAVCCAPLRGDTGERSVSDTALHSVTQHLGGVGDDIRGRGEEFAVLHSAPRTLCYLTHPCCSLNCPSD